MISRVSHTGLVAKNMEKMVKFYCEFFGFEVIMDSEVTGKVTDDIVNFHVESKRIVLLKLGETTVEILEYKPEGRSYPEDYMSNDIFGVHLAFETDDMEKDYLILKKEGVKIISSGPQTVPEGNPSLARTKVLYFQDPEGHPLELIQMPKGNTPI